MMASSSTVSGVGPWGWTSSGCGFDRRPGVVILELLRAEIAQGGMETASVVDLVDESRKIVSDIFEGFVGHRIDGFDLERLHEALGLGVDAPMLVKS